MDLQNFNGDFSAEGQAFLLYAKWRRCMPSGNARCIVAACSVSLQAFHCICDPKTARNLTSGAWHRRLPSATQIVQRREVEALYNIGLENSNDLFSSISRLAAYVKHVHDTATCCMTATRLGTQKGAICLWHKLRLKMNCNERYV